MHSVPPVMLLYALPVALHGAQVALVNRPFPTVPGAHGEQTPADEPPEPSGQMIGTA